MITVNTVRPAPPSAYVELTRRGSGYADQLRATWYRPGNQLELRIQADDREASMLVTPEDFKHFAEQVEALCAES